MLDSPGSAILHTDVSLDMIKEHPEHTTEQINDQTRSSISRLDLSGHSSGSADNKCEDSTYITFNGVYDGSAYSTPCSSGSVNDRYGDLAYASYGGSYEGYNGSASGGAGEKCDDSADLLRQTEKTHGKQSREHRKALSVNRIMGELQEMRDERTRDLRETQLLTKLQSLFLGAQLKKTLDEVSQELRQIESLSQAEMPEVQHVSLTKPEDTVAEPVWTPAPAIAGPVPIHREMSALPVTAQRINPSQSSEQTPAGQRLMPRSALASMTASLFEADAADSGETNGASQAFVSLPRRKRPLHPLPRSARTVVVRNVPWLCSLEDLLLDWPPDGTYDYLHVPYHFFESRPLGLAYLDFVTYEAMAAFQERWHGRFLSRQGHKSSLHIVAAYIQGRGPNLARIAEDKIPTLAEVRFLPVLFDGGRRLDTHEVIAELRRSYSTSENGACVRAYQ